MKRSILVVGCVALTLTLFILPRTFAQGARSSATIAVAPAVRTTTESVTETHGGMATLYALDPLSHSFCFADGKEGGVFQENETRNRCSDVEFGSYSADAFSVGVEGGRRGVIVDLGTTEELENLYRYTDTVGKGQGFASLHVEGGKVVILGNNKPRTFQEIKESAQLFGVGKGNASAPVKVGHIYLIRLTDSRDKSFQRIAKMKVISYTPGVSVTIRWQTL
jgi:hypothetical protein